MKFRRSTPVRPADGNAAEAGRNVTALRRYHIRAPSMVYLFVTLLVALGAFNSQNNLLFWAFGFSLAVVVVSGMISGPMLHGLTVVRENILEADQGGTAVIRYRVTNRNRLFASFGLRIEELTLESARRRDRAGQGAWMWTRHLGPIQAHILHVGPGQTVIAESRTSAMKRGRATFGAIRISSAFPFGILLKSVTFRQPGEAIVRPPTMALPRDLLDLGARVGESGVSRTARFGGGEDFFALREYRPGDDPRSIAWRPTARLGELLVRQTTSPAAVRLWVVLRLAGSQALGQPINAESEERIEHAISIAASVLTWARDHGMHVALAVPEAGIQHRPAAGWRHVERLLNDLGTIELDRLQRNADEFPAAAALAGRGRAACLVVHADGVERDYGPPNTQHLDAREFRRPAAAEAAG